MWVDIISGTKSQVQITFSYDNFSELMSAILLPSLQSLGGAIYAMQWRYYITSGAIYATAVALQIQ